MFDDEAAITNAIKAKEDDLGLLHDRMATDFDLFALTKYEPKDANGKTRKGYQSYTSSEPRNFFDKVLEGLNRAAMTLAILLPEGASQEETRKASEGELYLYGALAAIDRRLAKRGEPPLREALGHFICLRGLYAMRALVYTPKKGEGVVFDVLPWDPLHTTWESGADGLIWAAHKRQSPAASVEAEYGIEARGKTAEIVDFWDGERNSVLVDGVFAKKPTAHNIGHVPVIVRFVGSMPTMQSKEFEPTLEHQGDSVWSAGRGLYEANNREISSLMDMKERALTGSLVHQSKTGLKKIEGDPYRTYQEIPTEEGETITPLVLQGAPPETGAILGLISKDIQQSSLPYPLAYGGTTQAMSGRALAMLSDATRSVYTPRTGALVQAYTWLCEELLAQFASKGAGKAELYVTRPKGQGEQQFFHVQVGPDAINPNWFVHVQVEPQMPRDEEAAVMMALAATQRRGPEDIPLLSKGTARQSILQLQDPDAEEDKALAEMGKGLAPIMAANIAAALKKRGEVELAEQVMMLLRPPMPQQPSPQLPPQLVEAVVKALVESGNENIAKAFLLSLGAAGVGPASAPPSAPPVMVAPPPPPGGGEMMPPVPPPGVA